MKFSSFCLATTAGSDKALLWTQLDQQTLVVCRRQCWDYIHHTHTHRLRHADKHKHRYRYTCAHSHTHRHTETHTHTHTHTHPTHTRTHTHTHHTHTRTHTHTHTHTHKHTHTDAHSHTHSHTRTHAHTLNTPYLKIRELVSIHKLAHSNLPLECVHTSHTNNLQSKSPHHTTPPHTTPHIPSHHATPHYTAPHTTSHYCTAHTFFPVSVPSFTANTRGEEDMSELPNSTSSNCWKLPGEACSKEGLNEL